MTSLVYKALLVSDHGVQGYEILLKGAGGSLFINGKDGSVIRSSVVTRDTTGFSPPIGATEAAAMVLRDAGFRREEVLLKKLELHEHDRRLLYEVEFQVEHRK